jgi:aspartate--ammonia ligase
MQTLIENNSALKLIKSGIETEIAIEHVKTVFGNALMKNLNLLRVTAPIAVEENTGINDDLNGVERSVSFPISDMNNVNGVVVQSLAKWKRLRVRQLRMAPGQGIITDMKALRPDEKLSPIHSIYVDQWDWEVVITEKQRTVEHLKSVVVKIYQALLETESQVVRLYPQITQSLPNEIKFIHSQELLEKYPSLTPKERENAIAKEYGAVFIIGIGGELSNGKPHDGRAPDYDDWSTTTGNGLFGLNGDIIVWNPVSESALELSSMGIRVDKQSLLYQLKVRDCKDRSKLFFHKCLLNGELPQTMGGGIGQSRVCMFMLRKKHIGEVQVGIWPSSTRIVLQSEGVELI